MKQGVQPALALTPADTPAAMRISHDTLIDRAGQHRRSGISWLIYGPDTASIMASIHPTISGPQIAPLAPVSEGLALLRDRLAAVSSIADIESYNELAAAAANHPNAVLVIAMVDVDDAVEAS